jgi:hypothetical protein
MQWHALLVVAISFNRMAQAGSVNHKLPHINIATSASAAVAAAAATVAAAAPAASAAATSCAITAFQSHHLLILRVQQLLHLLVQEARCVGQSTPTSKPRVHVAVEARICRVDDEGRE